LNVLSQEDALSERDMDNFLSRLTTRSQDVLDLASQGTVNFFKRLGRKGKKRLTTMFSPNKWFLNGKTTIHQDSPHISNHLRATILF
jgi:hypothetical protein